MREAVVQLTGNGSNNHRHGDVYYIAAAPTFRSRACWLALFRNLNVRFATKATGGQFIVASSSYSMSMVVRPLLTFKHPRGSYLYLYYHWITSLVVKYLG